VIVITAKLGSQSEATRVKVMWGVRPAISSDGSVYRWSHRRAGVDQMFALRESACWVILIPLQWGGRGGLVEAQSDSRARSTCADCHVLDLTSCDRDPYNSLRSGLDPVRRSSSQDRCSFSLRRRYRWRYRRPIVRIALGCVHNPGR